MDRIFIDTVYVQALLNPRDQYHARASALRPRLRSADEVWITEAILVEICNALSVINRMAAVEFVRSCYRTPNMRVVSVDTRLMDRAVRLYESRPDKAWGLTDCLSFIVMQDQRLTDAFTADHHFEQAGFRAVLAAEP